MPNTLALNAEIVIAIECWDTSYEFRKIEKVGKNHMPTCPFFAGPVTYTHFTSFVLYDCSIVVNYRKWTM